jgi:DNA-binding NtrC family response regulator
MTIMTLPDVDRKLMSLGGRTRGPALPSLFDFDLASAVRTDASVLLTGSDDAVRAVAYRIHRLGEWREGPFTIVDCSAPVEIVERMLFEVFSGPALGAASSQARRGGSVLLHKIGQLDRAAQGRLADRLTLLRPTDAPATGRRVMASSAEPLLPRVLDGSFDDRLFYRLNVIHLVIPGERPASADRGITQVNRRLLTSRRIARDAGRTSPRLSLRG